MRHGSQNALFPVEAARPLPLVFSRRFVDGDGLPLVDAFVRPVAVERLLDPLVARDFAGVRQLAGHRDGAR